MATSKSAKPKVKGDFYDVHTKPGLDNFLDTLKAVIEGHLPITAVTIRIDALKNWAHDKQPDEGELYGLIIKKQKGEK